jgi:synaptojanin
MAGNKGAIAIRLEYGANSICFVTAHLAAGHSNIEQRNLDYHTIDHGLHFTRRRTISDHDFVFWASDSNYRIALTNEEVRKLIAEKNWSKLYENDQLNTGMIAGETFRYYNEGLITFPPTYKFDNGTDTYDTSEKQRVPAWTDRILYRGQGLKELDYSSVEILRASDHRPVYATFTVQVRIVDEPKREKFGKEIYEAKKNMIGDIIGGNLEALDISSWKCTWPCCPKLMLVPPPSSDKRKWWLDNDASSKVEIPKPPGDGWILNPKRPKNPFDPTDEPDWIKISAANVPAATPTPLTSPTKKLVAPPLPPPRRQQSELTPETPPDPDLLSRRASSMSLDGKPKPPVPPKPSFISARAVVSSPSPISQEPGDEEEFKPKPPLPPRVQTQPLENGSEKDAKGSTTDGRVGLIMDDEDGGQKVVGAWIPLQPSKEL